MEKVGQLGRGGSIDNRSFKKHKITCTIFHTFLQIILIGDVFGFRHSEGLNRWSFLSPNEGHDLYSDLLCPNPLVGGGSETRILESLKSLNNSGMLRTGDLNSPIPNDIWALKTSSEITFLPCDLKQYASVIHNNIKQQQQQFRNQTPGNGFVQNRLIFMNISFQPFDFKGAKLCNTFIKLQYDEEDGVELTCDENPLEGTESGMNHIYWPRNMQKRKKSFAIFRNLERFLQNEETLRRKFYFHIYFTSDNGRVKKCRVQQYELNLSTPGCSSNSMQPRINEICGEYNCKDSIFPYYEDEQRVKVIWKSKQQNNGKPSAQFPQYDSEHSTSKNTNNNNNNNNNTLSFFTSKKFDVRFIVFITTLPIVLFGMLIFGLEIIIYITCLRRPSTAGELRRDARSQQILQNSLNLWESIPNNREARSVSFSPVTTNIDADGSESPLPDPLLTPRVLKSALKKSTEHLPPPPASFFQDRECPPTYVEAMNH